MERLRAEYLKAVRQEWAKLRVVGEVEFSLGDRYVMPQVSASSSTGSLERRPDLPQTANRLGQAELKGKPELPPQKVLVGKELNAPMPLKKAFAQASHTVVLGAPGAGKTTALKFVGLCLATEGWAKERLGIDDEYVPILLELKEFAEDKALRPSIESAMAGTVNKFLRNPDEGSIRSLVETWLAEGKVFALLDGLDEVPEKMQSRIRDEIRHFAFSEKGGRNRVLLAARLAGFTALGEPFQEFVLRPLDGALEVTSYVENWLAALRPALTSSEVSRGAGQLIEEMKTQPALRSILDNPLILRLSAEVYAQNHTVAKDRAELYRRYLTVCWENAVERGAEQAKRDVTFKELEALAWRLQTQGKSEEVMDLNLLREKMGLVAKVGDEVIFSHTTFQEYFAACRLANAYRSSRQRAWAFLKPRLHLPAWREPILLLGEMLEDEASQALVWDVIRAGSSYEADLARDFVLAAELIEAGAKVDKRSSDALLTRAQRKISSRHAWGLKRIRSLIDEFNIRRGKFVEEQEPMRFAFLIEKLGVLGTVAIPFLVQTLREQNGRIREGAARALGKIQPSEILSCLLKLLKDEDPDIRSAAALAMGELRSAEVVPHLLAALEHDDDPNVRGEAALAVGNVRSVESVPHLLTALGGEESTVRYAICQALKEFRTKNAVTYLVAALDDEDPKVRSDVVSVLGKINSANNSAEIVPILLAALNDEDENVRSSASQSLKKIEGTEAVPHLCAALKSKSAYVRNVAAEVLGIIGSAEALLHLTATLEDSDPRVRISVIDALGKIGSPEAISPLTKLLVREIPGIRPWVLAALGEIGSPEAAQYPLAALKDKDREFRFAAAYGLRKTYPSAALPHLLAVLRDKSYQDEVRSVAGDALGEMRTAEALPHLLECLEDQDWRVRMYAAGALEEYKSEETVPHLLKLAHYNDRDVQLAAYGALAKIRSTEAVPYFLSALQDPQVCLVSIRTLGEIGDPKAVPNLSKLLNDDGWALEASKALAKILSLEKIPSTPKVRRRRATLLGQVSRVLVREISRSSYNSELVYLCEQTAVRLAELELASGRYADDPFKAVPEIAAKLALRKAGVGFTLVILLGIAALVGVLAGAAGDILKEQWKAAIGGWRGAHPRWVLVVVVAGLGAVVVLLALLVDQIKGRWKAAVMKNGD